MQEKALSQVLGFLGGPAPAADVRVKRVPVGSTELPERGLGSRCLALGREQHHGPPPSTECVGDVSQRAIVRLQGIPSESGLVYHARPEFEAKPCTKTRVIAPAKINASLAGGDFFANFLEFLTLSSGNR